VLYYDNHDTVRFRVDEEHWFDQSPKGPSAAALDPAAAPPRSPYTLLASMEDAGLGPCLWWDGDQDGDEEMEG
jgi:DNA-directed RNA polymerase III subunit RPC8